MPDTAAQMRVEDPFDPAPAVNASGRYLAEQLRRFRDVPLAVAAYNAGPGSVNGRVPRNGETEFYVAKVLAAYEHTRPKAPVVAKRPAVGAPVKTAPVARATAKAPVAQATAKAPVSPAAARKAPAPSANARPPKVTAPGQKPVLAAARKPAASR
jgi:hypothetical protein